MHQGLRDLLVAARHSATLTQGQLAEKLARPQSFVSKYESGERRLDVVEFIEVCRAMGCSPIEVIRKVIRTT